MLASAIVDKMSGRPKGDQDIGLGSEKERSGYMAVINMVNNIKELFPEFLLLFKIGTFYEVYNDDASIISYLFKYKIKSLFLFDLVYGFPVGSMNKIILC